MDIPGNLLIIVGIIIVVLGIFAGMLLSTLREEGEPEEDSRDEAPPGGRKGRYTPVTRLWREKESGALVVEIGGKAFIGPEALSDEHRRQLEQNARDLRAWLGMGISPAQPEDGRQVHPPAYMPPAHMPPAPAPPAAGAADAPPAGVPFPAAESTAAAEPRPATPAPAAPAVHHEPAHFDPPPVVSSGKSIVMQIEDILQDMIAGTPLARRGLHLHEDPMRGVIVQVGASTFEGIDAVPEPDVKATIRAAVAEWEKSQ